MEPRKKAMFEDLDVWDDAKKLYVRIYRLTQGFPGEERFGMTSQMRRASVSINANLAEGYGRHGVNERRHFINIASGSASEVLALVLLAQEVDLLREEDVNDLVSRIDTILNRLTRLHSYWSKQD
jgi:four helix bundle protein